MTDQPWAEPGLSPEERANALVAAVAMPLVPEIVEAMRAVRADALEEAARCAARWRGDVSQPLHSRLVAAEEAIANVDTARARCAIMRELVDGERERVAREIEETLGRIIWRPAQPAQDAPTA